ncbi:MAG: hypothetical protein MJ110_06845 [Lachnospiraceae bacterium]|nr:hypothetical protein [Lachnospiraceae bacterium]
MVTIPNKEVEMDCIERAMIGMEALNPSDEQNIDGGFLVVKPGSIEISTISEANAQTYINAMAGPFDMISINDIGFIYTQRGVIGAGLAFYFFSPFIVGKSAEKGLEPLSKEEMKEARDLLKSMECDGEIDGNLHYFYKFIDFYEEDDEEEEDEDDEIDFFGELDESEYDADTLEDIKRCRAGMNAVLNYCYKLVEGRA